MQFNPHIKAQAVLELSVSIFCMLLLLFGALQIFFWMNDRMVKRQQEYNSTRVLAGHTIPIVVAFDPINWSSRIQVNESNETLFPKLDIFGEND
jgi:hypothetical protein